MVTVYNYISLSHRLASTDSIYIYKHIIISEALYKNIYIWMNILSIRDLFEINPLTLYVDLSLLCWASRLQ